MVPMTTDRSEAPPPLDAMVPMTTDRSEAPPPLEAIAAEENSAGGDGCEIQRDGYGDYLDVLILALEELSAASERARAAAAAVSAAVRRSARDEKVCSGSDESALFLALPPPLPHNCLVTVREGPGVASSRDGPAVEVSSERSADGLAGEVRRPSNRGEVNEVDLADAVAAHGTADALQNKLNPIIDDWTKPPAKHSSTLNVTSSLAHSESSKNIPHRRPSVNISLEPYSKESHNPGDGILSTGEAFDNYVNEDAVYGGVCHRGLMKLCAAVANPESGSNGTIDGNESERRWNDVRRYLKERPEEVEESFSLSYFQLSKECQERLLGFAETKVMLNSLFTRRSVLSIIMMDFYFQVLLISAYSNASSSYLLNGVTDWQHLLVLSLPVAWFGMREVTQMATSSYWAYIGTLENWIDNIQIALVIASMVVMGSSDSDDSSTGILLIVTVGVVWIHLLGHLKNLNYGIAVFYVSVTQIIVELVPFLIVTYVILASFTFMFYNDYIMSEICADGDGDNSSLCTWGGISYLFGVLNAYLIGGLEAETIIEEGNPTFQALLYIYGLIVSIVLLNILIAKVSNIFSRVEDNGSKIFWENRVAIVLEARLIMWELRKLLPQSTLKCLSFADKWDKQRGFSRLMRPETHPQAHKHDKNIDDSYIQLSDNFILWFDKRTTLLLRLLVPPVLVLWFLLGLVSCGLLWPRWMTKMLFQGDEKRCDEGIVEQMKQEADKILSKMQASLDSQTREDQKEVQMTVASLEKSDSLNFA